jgi:hypothetical protein
MATEMSIELTGRDGVTTVDADPYLVCGVVYKEIHLEILNGHRSGAITREIQEAKRTRPQSQTRSRTRRSTLRRHYSYTGSEKKQLCMI